MGEGKARRRNWVRVFRSQILSSCAGLPSSCAIFFERGVSISAVLIRVVSNNVRLIATKAGLLFCCLALIVQTIFAGVIPACNLPASTKGGASPVGTENACHCGGGSEPRSCCHTKARQGSSQRKTALNNQSGQCKCEIQPAPRLALTPSVLPAIPVSIAAVVPSEAVLIAPTLTYSEPGIFGIDSGPPIPVMRVPDLGRAPPVA